MYQGSNSRGFARDYLICYDSKGFFWIIWNLLRILWVFQILWYFLFFTFLPNFGDSWSILRDFLKLVNVRKSSLGFFQAVKESRWFFFNFSGFLLWIHHLICFLFLFLNSFYWLWILSQGVLLTRLDLGHE